MMQDPFAPYMVDVAGFTFDDVGLGNGMGLDLENTT